MAATSAPAAHGRSAGQPWRRLLHGIEDREVLSGHMDGKHGPAMFRHACAMGLERIVSKRRDRPYGSGRSPDWIKVNNPDAPDATRIMEF